MALSEPLAGAPGVAADHRFHPLRVSRVTDETVDTRSLGLEVPEDLRSTFTYEAGQFCTFRVWVEGQPHVRCYSMSSAPAVDSELRVTVKRKAGGVVSNWVNDHLAAGDILDVAHPTGLFRLTGEGEVVLFCAGSGITPVLSLLKTALATTSRPARLLYANWDLDAVIFRTEIASLRTRYASRFTLDHHLDVDRGLIGSDAIEEFTKGADDPEYYVCGPGPFMEIVENTLLAGGVDAARIHIERFTIEAWRPEPEPIDASVGTSQITIELDGRTQTTHHHPGTTILQTARQMGMAPPFSCEAGSCATCMARLLEGTASMHVNNALTEDEVAEGWVLTCQALPTSPLVHVAYGYEEN
jgi:ferredoxin-NADP reductase